MVETVVPKLNDYVDDDEGNNGFSQLKVSTTTVTASFPYPINIVDVAKYLPLDDVIIGIKLVYAGGGSSIIRGVAKMSKKAKDFYNQVTFTIRLPMKNCSSILVSCKIFHNGTLHVTGTHTLQEATDASNLLLTRLLLLKGCKMVALRKDIKFTTSFDNLIYSSNGNVIGWIDKRTISELEMTIDDSTTDFFGTNPIIYLKSEYVMPEYIDISKLSSGGLKALVFVSSKWIDNCKKIYSVDGEEIGQKVLNFKLNNSRRHYEVKYGRIYSGNKIVGNEDIVWQDDYVQKLNSSSKYQKYLLEKGGLMHNISAFPYYDNNDNKLIHKTRFVDTDFFTHMINMFFKAPFKICRKRLHKTFLDKGYYSRFEPCSHAAVNLRFHYNDLTLNDDENRGKCIKIFKRTCNCKDISVSCFNSGKMNITGLATLQQGTIVYDFLKNFFISHKEAIFADVS